MFQVGGTVLGHMKLYKNITVPKTNNNNNNNNNNNWKLGVGNSRSDMCFFLGLGIGLFLGAVCCYFREG